MRDSMQAVELGRIVSSVLAFLLACVLMAGTGLLLQGCSSGNQQGSNKAEEQAEEEKSEEASEPDLSEWMFYDSDSRYLDEDDLEGLSDWDLKVARNEIFARHGRGFKSDDLQEYFDSKSWYEEKYDPDEFDSEHSDDLNKYEKKNVDFIASYEGPKYDYFDESGDYSADLSELDDISFSGSTMTIVGALYVDSANRSIRPATRHFKLADNCEFVSDWGDGGDSSASSIKKDLEANVGSWGTIEFEIRGGEVVRIESGA